MDEFVTPYDDDDALFIECKVQWLNLPTAEANEFDASEAAFHYGRMIQINKQTSRYLKDFL